jgi:hypothetical protein
VIAVRCAVASFGTFFSMSLRLLAFPVAVGMLAHAVRWALISVAGENAPNGALVACLLVSVIATPIACICPSRLSPSPPSSHQCRLFLFNAATGLVELVSIGPRAPAALLTSIAATGVTAFLIIMAMTFGLILPRMLLEGIKSCPAR